MLASRLSPRASSHTFFDLARQIDGRLPGRIARADQRHLLTLQSRASIGEAQ